MKHKVLKSFALGLAIFFTADVSAQITLPAPSPKGVVKQTIGLTDITIDYSRPSVKGRKVFGELVPFGVLWRTGANMATTIQTTDDIMINGQSLKAGRYSIFTIPGESEWTIIINKNADQGGTDSYKQEEDAMRFTVKSEDSDFDETMTFSFQNVTGNSATIDFEWDKRKVSIPVKVDTDSKAIKNIKNATDNAWNMYARAANYYLQAGNTKDANDMINKSLMLKSDFYNNWIKAQILAKENNYKEALKYAETATNLGKAEGDKGMYRFFSPEVDKAMAEYKEKAGSKKK